MRYHRRCGNSLPLLVFITCGIIGLLSATRSAFAAGTPSTHEIVYTAEGGVLGGPAKILTDDIIAYGGKRVGELWQANSSLSFNIVDGGTGGAATVTISYTNGMKTPATTTMKVNGGAITVTLPPTAGWGGSRADYGSVTVPCSLNAGMTNTISFWGAGTAWICDKIIVHPTVHIAVSTMLEHGLGKAVVDYWPYLLLLVIIGVAILILKKDAQYQ